MSRINTNVASLNAQRNISQTNQAFGRTVGRLSSGFRINRAADDAAGLGIANQLRSDIRALNQASRNASQANSLLQVAEGATNQVSSIVDRMKELASQSASDSVNDGSRALIQAEFAQLQEEITRIVDTTKFQGTSLLAGSEFTGTGLDAADVGAINGLAAFSGLAVTGGDVADLAAGGYTFGVDGNNITLTGGGETVSFALNLDAQPTPETTGGQTAAFTFANGVQISVDIADGATVAALTTQVDTQSFGVDGTSDGQLQFLVSVSGNAATGEDFISLNVQDLRLGSLGLDASTLATRDDAVAAIASLDSAISTISSALGDIGAAQNRLDFAQANVATTIENFSAAESVIRDADFAAEASEFARLQILQQSQIAMLAQANSAPQGVLQLIG
jgi:flagellin